MPLANKVTQMPSSIVEGRVSVPIGTPSLDAVAGLHEQ